MHYFNLLSDMLEINSDTPCIIAIDGVAGSGKTTLALNLLKDLPSVQVVHMDDLYDGWEDPLSQKLKDRVLTQILEPFSSNLPVKYQCFNWQLNRFDNQKIVDKCDFLILEGVGAGQNSFRSYLKKIIWMEIDPLVGLERVVTRDGEQVRDKMAKFLIDQNTHFLVESTRNKADYTLTGAP
jgi:uridine kinase